MIMRSFWDLSSSPGAGKDSKKSWQYTVGQKYSVSITRGVWPGTSFHQSHLRTRCMHAMLKSESLTNIHACFINLTSIILTSFRCIKRNRIAQLTVVTLIQDENTGSDLGERPELIGASMDRLQASHRSFPAGRHIELTMVDQRRTQIEASFDDDVLCPLVFWVIGSPELDLHGMAISESVRHELKCEACQ